MGLKRPLQRKQSRPKHSQLIVRSCPSRTTRRCQATISAGSVTFPCVIGKAGTARVKLEGDNKTPLGEHALCWGYFRRDRIARPVSRLPMSPIRPTDGWCDDIRSSNYNRPIKLPYPARHEKMSRLDDLYDVVLVLGYNFPRTKRGAGSAIFLHVWRSSTEGTEGCVAVSLGTLRKLLGRLAATAAVKITS